MDLHNVRGARIFSSCDRFYRQSAGVQVQSSQFAAAQNRHRAAQSAGKFRQDLPGLPIYYLNFRSTERGK